MSRPNRKKNNKKKKGTGGAGTPTIPDTPSSGVQAGRGEEGITRESNASLSLSSNSAAGTAPSSLAEKLPKDGPATTQGGLGSSPQKESGPSPQREPGPSSQVQPTGALSQKEKELPKVAPAAADDAPLVPASGRRQSGGKPVQSSAVKKTTIEEGTPTATAAAASSGTTAPNDATKETSSQTCVCNLQ